MTRATAFVFFIVGVEYTCPLTCPIGPDEATGESSIPVSLAVNALDRFVSEHIIHILHRTHQLIVDRVQNFVYRSRMAGPAGF
jgi:hypothetical protein